jgi:hypothetical protein
MTTQHVSIMFAPLLPWLAIAILATPAAGAVQAGRRRLASAAGAPRRPVRCQPDADRRERAPIDDVAVVVLTGRKASA